MLSRVAETLYWIARYLERAEDTARLLDVHYHALLDAQVPTTASRGSGSSRCSATRPRYREHYDDYTRPDVAEWVLWHDGNPSAVASCITLARENARSVREQISGEMWEAINGLFLLVGRANRRAAVRGPRTRSSRSSAAARTASRARRRDDDARRAVRVPPARPPSRARRDHRCASSPRYPVAVALAEDDPLRAHELIALLKSCSAFEAYRGATARRSSRSRSPRS